MRRILAIHRAPASWNNLACGRKLNGSGTTHGTTFIPQCGSWTPPAEGWQVHGMARAPRLLIGRRSPCCVTLALTRRS